MAGQTDDVIQHLAEAEAGLWLSESLILSLIRAGVLDKQNAIEAIETVIEAKRSILSETSSPDIARLAIGILSAIANSIAASPGPRFSDRQAVKPSRSSRHSARGSNQ